MGEQQRQLTREHTDLAQCSPFAYEMSAVVWLLLMLVVLVLAGVSLVPRPSAASFLVAYVTF